MSEEYILPKVWIDDSSHGGKFASINRPSAGKRFEKDLEVGEAPLQLYSLATPNGVKVAIMLEELKALNISAAAYDAHLINILEGDQFSSGFVQMNPNSKIPALLDQSDPMRPIHIFESGHILLYLADKFKVFLSEDWHTRTKTLNWLFWQMGAGPLLGGGFGHFFAYAPYKMKYPIDRFSMEVKRQFDLLDKHLANHHFIAGPEYSIADMAIYPWYGVMALGDLYAGSREFLKLDEYKNLLRWAHEIAQRQTVQKAKEVTKIDFSK